MYIVTVTLLLFVLPMLSIFVERILFHTALPLLLLSGMWFVFWAVGVRLFAAGLRQIKQPEYTAEEILGIKAKEAHFIVRELGFANFASGTLGIASLFVPAWVLPAALVGGLYYGLAGVQHFRKEDKNHLEQFATYSDIAISLFLLIFFVLQYYTSQMRLV